MATTFIFWCRACQLTVQLRSSPCSRVCWGGNCFVVVLRLKSSCGEPSSGQTATLWRQLGNTKVKTRCAATFAIKATRATINSSTFKPPPLITVSKAEKLHPKVTLSFKYSAARGGDSLLDTKKAEPKAPLFLSQTNLLNRRHAFRPDGLLRRARMKAQAID